MCGRQRFVSRDQNTGWKRESWDIWGTWEKSFHFPSQFSMHSFKARPNGRRNADKTGKEVSAIDLCAQSLLGAANLNLGGSSAHRVWKNLEHRTKQFIIITVTNTIFLNLFDWFFTSVWWRAHSKVSTRNKNWWLDQLCLPLPALSLRIFSKYLTKPTAKWQLFVHQKPALKLLFSF